jgi:hypothetical protein
MNVFLRYNHKHERGGNAFKFISGRWYGNVKSNYGLTLEMLNRQP